VGGGGGTLKGELEEKNTGTNWGKHPHGKVWIGLLSALGKNRLQSFFFAHPGVGEGGEVVWGGGPVCLGGGGCVTTKKKRKRGGGGG